MKRSFLPTFFLTIFIPLFFIDQANATVILKKSFSQVIHGSELIFEGRVVSKETRPLPINDKPFTFFIIEIIDIIKGSYPHTTIETGYMGGRIGELTLEVSDMRMPEVGERGIYFVETLNEQQIHPLFGWQQGHYLVITNQQTGQEMVIPIKQKDIKARSSMLQKGSNLVDFKVNIYNIMGIEK